MSNENKKDWTGSHQSAFKQLGASNHCKDKREENDFYATDPVAIDWLLKYEEFDTAIWEPACVDSETEFFNGNEWKKISDFQYGEKVLCFDGKNGVLLEPIKYHKKYTNEDLCYFSNSKLDMVFSEEHKVVYEHRRHKKICFDFAKNVFQKYEKDSNGFRGKILTTFNLNGTLEIDEWKMRLAIACNADGRTRTKNKKTYQIRVKKERKAERLKMILEKTNIPYKLKKDNDYFDFTFESQYGCKEFPIEWLYLKDELKEKFIEELGYWDGTFQNNKIVYSTSKKKDADFIQLLAASIGINVQFSYDDRTQNTNFRLTFSKKNKHSLKKTKISKLEKIKPKDNFKYCFTVDTGMLVLRRNNKIFITGNCGSGHLSKRLKEHGYKVYNSDIIDRGYEDFNQVLDFLNFDGTYQGDIITNPPYKYCSEFIKKSLDVVNDGHKVAMFLKLQTLEGQKRYQEIFSITPPKSVYVFVKRVACGKNGKFDSGSSAVCYAWFVWEKGWKGDTTLKWINNN